MKKLPWLFILIFYSQLLEAFVLFSPFPSQIQTQTGISIPNARFVDGDEQILRSMRPWKRDPAAPLDQPNEITQMVVDFDLVDQLLRANVSDVLIFKNQEPDRNDLEIEKAALISRGFVPERITTIEFPWKNFREFEPVCRMTLQALRLIKNFKNERLLDGAHRRFLFHCTVGEDRTGYLSFLFALLNEQELSTHPERVRELFQEEACRGGYEGGNANKDERVRVAIRQALTPLASKMAYKIQKGYLSWENLSDRQCEIDPADFEIYDRDRLFDPERFRCETSPDFPG